MEVSSGELGGNKRRLILRDVIIIVFVIIIFLYVITITNGLLLFRESRMIIIASP